MNNDKPSVEKPPSGIIGFDTISQGGLPKGRIALVSGTVGSGKTVFAAHFLAEGIKQWDEHAVFAIGKPFRNVAGILAGVMKPLDLSQYEFLEEEVEREQ